MASGRVTKRDRVKLTLSWSETLYLRNLVGRQISEPHPVELYRVLAILVPPAD